MLLQAKAAAYASISAAGFATTGTMAYLLRKEEFIEKCCMTGMSSFLLFCTGYTSYSFGKSALELFRKARSLRLIKRKKPSLASKEEGTNENSLDEK